MLGDHRAAQGISPCLRHRDRHSFPAKELLKEVGEAKRQKKPRLGHRRDLLGRTFSWHKAV